MEMETIDMERATERRGATRAARWTRAAVPCAILCAFFCCGCPKKKEPPPDPSSPESYMNDEKFRGRLAEERKAHVALLRDRNAIAERMKSMIEAKKAELKTDDLKAVQEALEKDPAWKDLYSQCTNANAKIEAHSRMRLGIVRNRIAPKQQKKEPVSK